LRQRGAADRLKNDSIGAVLRLGLHEREDLLALLNAVAVGVKDLHIDTESASSFFSGDGLLDLVIVILRY